jgi:hypothetical protein
MSSASQARISDVRHKIERAKKHIRDLNGAIGAFLDSSPYEIATKQDPQTRHPIHYLAKVADVPAEISLIAGDAIHNLRPSLDHLAHGLVLANGQAPGKNTYFPICEDVNKYNSPDTLAKKKGMSTAAQNLIDATKPYQGGNDDFWILHRLDNIDKHRLILAIGSSFRSVDIGGFTVRKMAKASGIDISNVAPLMSGMFLGPVDGLYPLEAGKELFIGPPDSEADNDLQFRFQIAIGEPQVIRGQRLLETLQKLAHLVDGVASQFEPML